MTADARPSLPELADAFGLVAPDPESLTRFARVHRARTVSGQEVVVKRAGSMPGRVRAIDAWTRALAGDGVSVVTPVGLDVANPQQVGDDWWVVYPYLDGTAYRGSETHIETAGDLLGRIHATAAATDGMRDYEWPDTSEQEVADDLVTLDRVLTEQGDPAAFEPVRELASRWWTARDALRGRDGDLPRAGVSSDFKANNLVWVGGAPVLVDPDNGGCEPRLFELAFVACLFHNECDGAPGRLLNEQEWGRFLTAYGRHVTLSAAELELWPLVFDHILWEEGTWVLEDNDEQAWRDPHQRAFLLDLARASVERFPLSPS